MQLLASEKVGTRLAEAKLINNSAIQTKIAGGAGGIL